MKRVAALLLGPAVAAALVLGVAATYPIDNPDTFGHLAAGRQIFQLGRVPRLDSFSYFRSEPVAFVNYEWLSDLLLFATYRVGGYAGLTVLRLLLVAALGGLLVATSRARASAPGDPRRAGSDPARWAAWLTVLVLISDLPGLRFRLSVRPQLFGMVLAALYLFGLLRILNVERARAAYGWVLGLAVAHVLWVNLHGSHLLGYALVVLALLCSARAPSARRPLASLLGLCTLASCVSPYGPAIVSGAIAHALDPAYRAVIEEWQAWHPPQSTLYPLVIAWQAGGLLLRWRGLSRDRVLAFSLSSALLLLLMAARSLRFIADFLALTAPLVAAGLATPLAALAPLRRRAVLIGASATLAPLACWACLQLPPGSAFGFGTSTAGRPLASAAWLQRHLPNARIFAAMSDSWDLMFSLPAARFLIDGRTPLYGPTYIARVQRAFGAAPRLRELIDSSRTDAVILQPLVREQQPALLAMLARSDFWLVAIEAQHCLFIRDDVRRHQLLAPLALRVLRPGYDAAWLLASKLDATAVARELSELPPHRNVDAYRDWVLGLLELRPLARAEGRAGFSAPRDRADLARLSRALPRLRATDRALAIVPSVQAYYALAAVSACRLDDATDVIERARAEGETRELLFARQELALRRGQLQAVRTFLNQAKALPGAAADPFIQALEAELVAPPLCPPALDDGPAPAARDRASLGSL
jgi:hypothetical protein